MRRRRVIERIRNQDWVPLFLDFIVVVLGIFVALQVNSWNEVRKDRLDEQRFLPRLHDDLELAEGMTSRLRDRRLSNLQSLITASEVLFGRAGRDQLTRDECRALASAHFYNFSVSDLPSVAELVSTGRMGIVRDAKLRAALVGLRQIRAALELITKVQVEGAIQLSSEYPGLIELDSYFDPDRGEVRSHIRCDLPGMRADRRFLNDASSNSDRYDAWIRDGLAPWIQQLDTIHQLVDESLGIEHDAA